MLNLKTLWVTHTVMWLYFSKQNFHNYGFSCQLNHVAQNPISCIHWIVCFLPCIRYIHSYHLVMIITDIRMIIICKKNPPLDLKLSNSEIDSLKHAEVFYCSKPSWLMRCILWAAGSLSVIVTLLWVMNGMFCTNVRFMNVLQLYSYIFICKVPFCVSVITVQNIKSFYKVPARHTLYGDWDLICLI